MLELKGFNELNMALKQMKEEAVQYLEEPVNKVGEKIKSRAESKAKGDAKNSLERQNAKYKDGQIIGRVAIKRGYGWAVPYELGHNLVAWGRKTGKFINARPFLRPAVDESKDEAEKIFADAMNKLLDKFGDNK